MISDSTSVAEGFSRIEHMFYLMYAKDGQGNIVKQQHWGKFEFDIQAFMKF